MPAHYAHYRFGKQVLPKLPADARQCAQRFRRMYDMGLHGPDIFFYFNPFLKTAVGDLGGKFHAQTGQAFFPAACKAASSEAARAYLYGLLTHYCLDSICHPYVRRIVDIGEANHRELEAEFDRALLTLDKVPSPERYDLSGKLKLTRGECMTVAEFYPGATGGNISRSVKTMAFFAKFFSGGDQAKRKALLDRLKPGLSDGMIPAQEKEDLALYVGELRELYDQALEACPRMLEQLLAHMQTEEPLGEDFARDFG